MMKLAFLLALTAQFPDQPSKTLPTPAIPSKAPQAAFASPQVQAAPLASPQQAYAPQQALAPVQQYEAPAVVLRAVPQVYAIQRQVVLQAAPVAYAPVAYDTGCVVQQAVVQRSFVQHSAVVNHGVVHSAQVNHGVVAAAGRQPKKVITKQVTKVKRGLFGK